MEVECVQVRPQDVGDVRGTDRAPEEPNPTPTIETEVGGDFGVQPPLLPVGGWVARRVRRVAVLRRAEPLIRNYVRRVVDVGGSVPLIPDRHLVRVVEAGCIVDVQHPAANSVRKPRVVLRSSRKERGGKGVHRKGVAAAVGLTADEAVGVVAPPALKHRAPPGAYGRSTEDPVEVLAYVVVGAELRIHSRREVRRHLRQNLVEETRV